MAKDRIQEEELGAVSANIGELIIDWYNEHGVGYQFHLGELTRDILNKVMCSPTSPFRVMADLRKKGCLNYTVLNRSSSLYRIDPVDEIITLDTLDGEI